MSGARLVNFVRDKFRSAAGRGAFFLDVVRCSEDANGSEEDVDTDRKDGGSRRRVNDAYTRVFGAATPGARSPR